MELNLVAQDLTAYGHDLPEAEAARAPQGAVRGRRALDPAALRLPRDFQALIDVIANEPRIASYLDMPLQHCSDKLLRRMKRGRDGTFLRSLLARIRERVPGIVMRTSLIAGLPGETEEDFRELWPTS